MKLLSLNTWGGQLNRDFDEFIKKQAGSIDIFCFQEVFDKAHDTRPGLGPVHPDLYKELQVLLPSYIHYHAPSQDNDEGLAIFVKKALKVDKSGDIFVHRWFNAMVGDDGATMGRNIQYIEFRHDGATYTVVNFHGLWNGLGKIDTPERFEQSKNVKKFLDSAKGYKILCGDFNLMPNTESIAIIEKGMRNLIKDYDIKTTRSRHYKTTGEKFADYIIVSPGLKVIDFQVLKDPISDHLPMLLEFE
jgi:endonuclease/exonuclease/phosphatase family metal-dependent hydrolase